MLLILCLNHVLEKGISTIVFTHDTSFLGQLCDEINVTGVSHSMMFLEWFGDYAGHVNGGLPWDHKGYKERIDALEKSQSKLSKAWPTYPSEEDIASMRQQYDRLRATLERVIQDVVFNGVVKRYRDWIKVDSLGEVVGFTQAEFDAIAKLHKRCCDVVTAHDPASDKSASILNTTDLKDDINELKNIADTVKQRKKSLKGTT